MYLVLGDLGQLGMRIRLSGWGAGVGAAEVLGLLGLHIKGGLPALCYP